MDLLCAQLMDLLCAQLICAQLMDLQKECRCAVPTSDQLCGQTCFVIGSRHRAASFCLQVPKLYTDLDPTFFYIVVLKTYSKFARKTTKLVLGGCFLQPCPSADHFSPVDHVLITTDQLVCFKKNEFDEMRINLDSTENPSSFKKHPTLSLPVNTLFSTNQGSQSWGASIFGMGWLRLVGSLKF